MSGHDDRISCEDVYGEDFELSEDDQIAFECQIHTAEPESLQPTRNSLDSVFDLIYALWSQIRKTASRLWRSNKQEDIPW